MGMRIHKDIGYLLENAKLSSIVVDNYVDILENLDEDDDIQLDFFSKLESLLKDYKNSKGTSEHIFVRAISKDFASKCAKNKSYPFHFVKKFFMCDDDMGILFRSEHLFKACRYDDLIDYYECGLDEHKINYLNRPLYPCTGYIYKGGLESLFPELVVGFVYEEFDIKHMYLVDVKVASEASDNKIINSGFFVPNIESFVYLVAKASGILKSTVSEHEFNCALKPIIATYWA